MRVEYFEDYKCVYDDKNNLIEVYEYDILTCRYQYNENSKVIREDNYLLGLTITYKYNEYNNLIQRNYYNFSLSELQYAKHTDNFTYDKENPERLIAFNDETFTYDDHGRPLSFRNAKLKLSKSNNLLKLHDYSFKYNKNNFRIKKTIGNETTKFYRKSDKLLKQVNGSQLIFSYKQNEICGFKYQNQDYTYKKNYVGDIVGIYNANHDLICQYVYDFNGNHQMFVKNDNNLYLNVANLNPVRFHSAYYDVETGLYYSNGKYYDSEVCRFINV